MSVSIHPTALVDKNAQLGDGVEIGPYASIGPDVKLGARTVVQQGAIIRGHSTLGEDCQVFPYACIGMKTQDPKYTEGSVSYVAIGGRTVIRASAPAHPGRAARRRCSATTSSSWPTATPRTASSSATT